MQVGEDRRTWDKTTQLLEDSPLEAEDGRKTQFHEWSTMDTKKR